MVRDIIIEDGCENCKRYGEHIEMCQPCLETWFLMKMSA